MQNALYRLSLRKFFPRHYKTHLMKPKFLKLKNLSLVYKDLPPTIKNDPFPQFFCHLQFLQNLKTTYRFSVF